MCIRGIFRLNPKSCFSLSMNFIPNFNFELVFLKPWSSTELMEWNGQIILMGLLICWTSGIIGSFVVVRKMALMGDAISHGILPGLVISFLICGTLEIGPMLAGACIAGVFCSFCIEWLRHNTEIRQDASMAIVFTTFFAFGVTLINLQTGHLDLDTSCVLYGEIGLTPLATDWIIAGENLGNRSLWLMGFICLITLISTSLFYRQLLLTSFDPILSRSIGWPVKFIHFALMFFLALCTVASLESVGVILVVAMLIFPCVTASFFFDRLSVILFCTFPLGIFYTFGGFHLALWLDCSIAAAMVISATVIFIFALIFNPQNGFISIWKSLKSTSK